MKYFKIITQENAANGTSFAKAMPRVSNAQIERFFGHLPKGTDEKYSDNIVIVPTSRHWKLGTGVLGYGGKNILAVYARYGEWRIGANNAAPVLIEKLYKQISQA